MGIVLVLLVSLLAWPGKEQGKELGEIEKQQQERTKTNESSAERASTSGVKKLESFKLTIMHTNDTHTVIDNIARRSSIIKQIREESENNLLLSAGDITSWEIGKKRFDSFANAVFMNHLRYDGMVLGNHEFDLGEGISDHAPLSMYVKNANHPVLAANVDFSQDKFLEPYADYNYTKEPQEGRINKGFVTSSNGEQIGIFGITHYNEVVTVPGDVSFTDYTKAAKESVEQFEIMGVDKIIALTHIGIGHDRTLAKEVPEIDVIIGGHSHVTVNPPNQIGNTLVVQTGEYDTYLGELELVFDEEGIISDYSGKLHKIRGAPELEDTQRVKELFHEEAKAGNLNYEEFIGKLIERGVLEKYQIFWNK